MVEDELVLWFEEVGIADVGKVGGKNASLGEMIRQLGPKGVKVPGGFATTAYAYRYFIKTNGLDQQLRDLFADLNTEDVHNLRARGRKARALILGANFPKDLEDAIIESYKKLCERYPVSENHNGGGFFTDVAIFNHSS